MYYVDLTHTVAADMPSYPGDTPVEVRRTRTVAEHGSCAHVLRTGMHSGTHVDYPMHMLEGADEYICAADISRFIGPAVTVDARGMDVIGPERFGAVGRGDIVLIYTGFDAVFGRPEYFTSFPALSDELAELFVTHCVKMVGIDFPSVDRSPYSVHKRLLPEGILIAENLTNLDKLLGKRAKFYAVPLKIQAEGSIVRAFAEVES